MQVLPKLFKLWPWADLYPFYAKVKFGDIGFCIGKVKNIYCLETIAALGLKVAWSIQLNELMKLSIKGQGHSLTLVKGHSDFKVKCLTFGLYTQVSNSGPHGPLVFGVAIHSALWYGKMQSRSTHMKSRIKWIFFHFLSLNHVQKEKLLKTIKNEL